MFSNIKTWSEIEEKSTGDYSSLCVMAHIMPTLQQMTKQNWKWNRSVTNTAGHFGQFHLSTALKHQKDFVEPR